MPTTDRARHAATPGTKRDRDLDPGAFVGRKPERQAETIPGGIGPKDERIAASDTQSGAVIDPPEPSGHREPSAAADRREAGRDR